MARIPMVTRTIKETVASVMYVNVETAKVDYCDYRLAGTFDNNEVLMKALKKLYENDTIKLVNIVNVDTVENLYGMTEAEFMSYAKILPPRTTAEIQNENA